MAAPYVVHVDVPGVKQEHLAVKVRDNSMLCVTARRDLATDSNDMLYYVRERPSGRQGSGVC